MWTGQVVSVRKVADLFKLCGYNFLNSKVIEERSKLKVFHVDDVCCICRRREKAFYSVADVFSNTFTAFNFFTMSSYICLDCAGLVSDDSRGAGNFVLYYDEKTNQAKHLNFSRRDQLVLLSDAEKQFWKEFLLNPLQGYFSVILPSSAKAHYLIYAVLSYSDGNVEGYYCNVGSQVYYVDLRKFSRFIELREILQEVPKKERVSIVKELIEIENSSVIYGTLYRTFKPLLEYKKEKKEEKEE